MPALTDHRTRILNLLHSPLPGSASETFAPVLNDLLASDSLHTYIELNKMLFDSLVYKLGFNATREYLLNIFREEPRLSLADTLYQSVLTNAYYQYAARLNNLAFNDTIVRFFEKAILLNSKYQQLSPLRLVYCYKALGIQYNIAGDQLQALHNYEMEFISYQQAVKENINYDYLSGSALNRAILLAEMNRRDAALALVDTMLAIKEVPAKKRAALLAEKAQLEIDKGSIATIPEYLEAADRALAAVPVKTRQDSLERASLQADIMVTKGKLALLKQDGKAALTIFSKAKAIKLSDPDRAKRYVAKLLLDMAKAFLTEGQSDSAVLYCQRALFETEPQIDSLDVFANPLPAQLYAENTIQEALELKAVCLEEQFKKTGDLQFLQAAVASYSLCFGVEKKLMQYFSYDESKLELLQKSRNRSARAIAVCHQLYGLTGLKKWAEEAFMLAEQNKAFVLMEAVKRNMADNRLLEQDSVYRKMQSLQWQVAYTEARLAELIPDSIRLSLQAEKGVLENQLLLTKNMFVQQNETYRNMMKAEDSLTITGITEKLLSNNTSLIEFFSVDTTAYAFLLEKDKDILFYKLPSVINNSIDSLLYFYKSPFAISNDPAMYKKTAFSIYSASGLAQVDVNSSRLIIIPDGKFSFIPFEALVTRADTGLALNTASWVLYKYLPEYGYSASILLRQSRSLPEAGNKISVFAPVFDQGGRGLMPINFSVAEANSITKAAGAKAYLRSQASLANFKNDFQRADVIHLATHAFADTGGKTEPRIEFADSSLLLKELYSLHTSASLVVLSACETGLGNLSSSEGPLSLARGFYYAGARNVITSYWAVDDKNTASLFSSFYAQLPEHFSAAALHQAKREYLKNARGAQASPYYWAGFVHYGLGGQPRGHHYWWWLFPIAFLFLFFVWRKRRP